MKCNIRKWKLSDAKDLADGGDRRDFAYVFRGA